MLITHATIVTWESPNRVLADHAVYIVGDRIHSIGPSADLERAFPRARRLDASSQLLLPGIINTHTHFYSAFARGLAVPGSPPRDFPQVLERLWWPLDRALQEEDIRYSALLGLVDAIRTGTTTVFDHHASSRAIDGSLDVISEAVISSGARAVLCYEVTDRDGQDVADAGIRENLRFSRRLAANVHTNLAAMFGLHASLTLSGATLQACRASLPDGIGFHVHVAEHEMDEYDSLQKSGMRVVDRLQNHGILGPKSIAAHCVHIDAAEMQLLKETGTWTTHQPRSNMNNGVGTAPVESMLRLGIPVCIGTDGFSNGVVEDWRAAYLLHKAANRDPRRMDIGGIEQMGVKNSADLAHAYFTSAEIGQIVPGSFADLILVDYQPPTLLTGENAMGHLIFGTQPGMVTATIVGGKVLMKNRQLLTLDEERITARSRELAPRVWKRYEENLLT